MAASQSKKYISRVLETVKRGEPDNELYDGLCEEMSLDENFTKAFLERFPATLFKTIAPNKLSVSKKVPLFTVILRILKQHFRVPTGFREPEYSQRETLDIIFKHQSLLSSHRRATAHSSSSSDKHRQQKESTAQRRGTSNAPTSLDQVRNFSEYWHMLILSSFGTRERRLRELVGELAPLAMVVDHAFAGKSHREKMFVQAMCKYAQWCPDQFVDVLQRYLFQQQTRRKTLRSLLKILTSNSSTTSSMSRILFLRLYDCLLTTICHCLPLQRSHRDSASTSNRTESADSRSGDTEYQQNFGGDDQQIVTRTLSSTSVGSTASGATSPRLNTTASSTEELNTGKSGLHFAVDCPEWECYCLSVWSLVISLPVALPLVQAKLAPSLDALCRIIQAYFTARREKQHNSNGEDSWKKKESNKDGSGSDTCILLCMEDALQVLLGVFGRLFPHHCLHALRSCRDVLTNKSASTEGTSEATRQVKVDFVLFISTFLQHISSDLATALLFSSDSERDPSRWYALLPDMRAKAFKDEIRIGLFGSSNADTPCDPETVFLFLVGQTWENVAGVTEERRDPTVKKRSVSVQCSLIDEHDVSQGDTGDQASAPTGQVGGATGGLQFAMSPAYAGPTEGGNVSDFSLSSQSGSLVLGQSYHGKHEGAKVEKRSYQGDSTSDSSTHNTNTQEVDEGGSNAANDTAMAEQGTHMLGDTANEHNRWSTFLLKRFQEHGALCSLLLRKGSRGEDNLETSAKEDQAKLSLMFPDSEQRHSSDLPWDQTQVFFERHLRRLEAKKCRYLQAEIAKLEATTREGTSLRSLFNKQQSTISMLRKEIDRLQSRLKEIDATNGQRQASLKHQMGKLNDERHRLSEEVMAKTHTINHQSKKIEELASALNRCHTCDDDIQRNENHLRRVEQQRDEAVQEANDAKEELRRWKEFYLSASES